MVVVVVVAGAGAGAGGICFFHNNDSNQYFYVSSQKLHYLSSRGRGAAGAGFLQRRHSNSNTDNKALENTEMIIRKRKRGNGFNKEKEEGGHYHDKMKDNNNPEQRSRRSLDISSLPLMDVPIEGDPACPCLSMEDLMLQQKGRDEQQQHQQDVPVQDSNHNIFANSAATTTTSSSTSTADTSTNAHADTGDGTASSSPSKYGIGCGYHDLHSRFCSNTNSDQQENLDGAATPPLLLCEAPVAYCNTTSVNKIWCQQAWCYVDPNNCALAHEQGILRSDKGNSGGSGDSGGGGGSLNNDTTRLLPDLYYSYAACRNPDRFKRDPASWLFFQKNHHQQSHDKLVLSNKSIRVGLLHNPAGWRGAFSKIERSFDGPISLWSGPTWDFFLEGVRYLQQQQQIYGDYDDNNTSGSSSTIRSISSSDGSRVEDGLIELITPPDFLRKPSREYWGRSGPSDLCTYATALGYIDICVGEVIISAERLTSTDWIMLEPQDIYLITPVSVMPESYFNRWLIYTYTIFQAFTNDTWSFSVLCIIPLLSIFFFIHEFNHPSSPFQAKRRVIIHYPNGNQEEIERIIPIYENILHAIYYGYLGVLRLSYTPPVITLGGKMNLMGFSFFLLTFIAVYTANLANILTTSSGSQVFVNNVDEAIQSGLRFCATRELMVSVAHIYGINPTNFVVDPLDEGGDGLPGFNTRRLDPVSRVFDFITTETIAEEDDPSRYCSFAFAFRDDLELFQSKGLHCNKTTAGLPVWYRQMGMPVSEKAALRLVPLLQSVKNSGHYQQLLEESRPKSLCPPITTTAETETASLGIVQLCGIWIVAGAFSLFGLLLDWFIEYKRKRKEKRTGIREEYVKEFSQTGQEIDCHDHHDILEGRSITRASSGRTFLVDPLELSGRSKEVRSVLGKAMHLNQKKEKRTKDAKLEGDYRLVSLATGLTQTMSTTEYQLSSRSMRDVEIFRNGDDQDTTDSKLGYEVSECSSISTKTGFFDEMEADSFISFYSKHRGDDHLPRKRPQRKVKTSDDKKKGQRKQFTKNTIV